MSKMPKKSNVVETAICYPVRFYFYQPTKKPGGVDAYLVYGADLKGHRVGDHCLGYVVQVNGKWEAHAMKKDGSFSGRDVATILETIAPARTRTDAACNLFLHLRRFEFGKRLLLAAGVL